MEDYKDEKVIALLMVALMVLSMFTSCTTRSNIDVPSQRAEVFDKDGNKIGYMDIPASQSVLTWKDWTKGIIMGSLISGAVTTVIGMASVIAASRNSEPEHYGPNYVY